jgi:hypothetical protein
MLIKQKKITKLERKNNMSWFNSKKQNKEQHLVVGLYNENQVELSAKGYSRLEVPFSYFNQSEEGFGAAVLSNNRSIVWDMGYSGFPVKVRGCLLIGKKSIDGHDTEKLQTVDAYTTVCFEKDAMKIIFHSKDDVEDFLWD